MIISASRRTDIPAFFSQWFLQRLQDGYVYVRNPFNYQQVGQVTLSPDIVDCIVFWTKNPTNMLDKLDAMDRLGYHYYFQFTLNPYGPEVERGLPPKEQLIAVFQTLAKRVGRHRVVWRYDPILLTEKINQEYHYNNFEYLTKQLSEYTEQCVISFVQRYSKIQRKLDQVQATVITEADMRQITAAFATIAKTYDLSVKSCAEPFDFSAQGVLPAQCVDPDLIARIIGTPLSINKDPNQRQACGCCASIDIGAYNTCKHDCIYCYANYSAQAVNKNCNRHQQAAPMLLGQLEASDKLSIREVKSYREKQQRLF